MNRWVPRVLLAAGALAACGRIEWQEADWKLNEAAAAAKAAGYRPLAGPHNGFGTFSAAGADHFRVDLDAAGAYFVAAACAGGCDTLDLDVTGPGGAPLWRDTSETATPRLELRPPAAGAYTITVRFGACRSASCRWVGQVYRLAE